MYETSVLSGYYNRLFSVVMDISALTIVVSILPYLGFVILLHAVVWCLGKEQM